MAWISEKLKSGNLIEQGTELLRIDDASYRLTLTQAETQLKALDVKDKTTRASFALEERGQSLDGVGTVYAEPGRAGNAYGHRGQRQYPAGQRYQGAACWRHANV